MSVYGFWLPLWYLQTFLNSRNNYKTQQWTSWNKHIAGVNLVSPVSDIYLAPLYGNWTRDHRGRDCSWIYNYLCNQCLSPLKLWGRIMLMARCTRYSMMWWIFQQLAAGRWFSLDTPVFSSNKTDRHDITEKLLKVALNTITLTLTQAEYHYMI